MESAAIINTRLIMGGGHCSEPNLLNQSWNSELSLINSSVNCPTFCPCCGPNATTSNPSKYFWEVVLGSTRGSCANKFLHTLLDAPVDCQNTLMEVLDYDSGRDFRNAKSPSFNFPGKQSLLKLSSNLRSTHDTNTSCQSQPFFKKQICVS